VRPERSAQPLRNAPLRPPTRPPSQPRPRAAASAGTRGNRQQRGTAGAWKAPCRRRCDIAWPNPSNWPRITPAKPSNFAGSPGIYWGGKPAPKKSRQNRGSGAEETVALAVSLLKHFGPATRPGTDSSTLAPGRPVNGDTKPGVCIEPSRSQPSATPRGKGNDPTTKVEIAARRRTVRKCIGDRRRVIGAGAVEAGPAAEIVRSGLEGIFHHLQTPIDTTLTSSLHRRVD